MLNEEPLPMIKSFTDNEFALRSGVFEAEIQLPASVLFNTKTFADDVGCCDAEA
jgi:hypothetical protein